MKYLIILFLSFILVREVKSQASAGCIQEAIKWFEQILTMDEKTPLCLKTYSYLLYKSGQKDLAIRSMGKFIERTPIPPAVNDAGKDIAKMKKVIKITGSVIFF